MGSREVPTSSTTEVTPFDDYLEEAKTAAEQRRADDQRLWHNWVQSGKQPEHLEPLVQKFKPLVTQAVQQFKAPSIPASVFEAEVHEHLLDAFNSYNPDRAALSTHVVNMLRRSQRYNTKYQNIARIPAEPARMIGQIQQTQNALREDLGRDPTHGEIARTLGMNEKRLKNVMGAIRKDVFSSSFESDPTKAFSPREQEVFEALPQELSNDELVVFNHLYGREGFRQIASTSGIAKELGKSPSYVARIRTSISNKFKSFL